MNTEKEKQHYVPKFYLRNFSFQNNKKQIGVFNVKNQFYISHGKLKTQAYKPFYYGHDGKLEDFLSEIECNLSPITNQIIATKTLLNTNSHDHQLVLLFIILMQLRNPVTSNTLVNSRKELLRRAKEIVPDDADVETKVPTITKEHAIMLALTGIETGLSYCEDLKIKLLINSTDIPFITSDNPVAKYNQYLEGRKWFGGWTGYGAIGLQIFLPLNAEITILLYDSWTYKIGDKKKDIVNITTDDVNQLNIIQMLNCEETVFFNERASQYYLNTIYKSSLRFDKPNQPFSEVLMKIDEYGKVQERSKIISTGSTNLSTHLQLSEVTLTKQAKQYQFDNRVVQLRPRALALRQKEREFNR